MSDWSLPPLSVGEFTPAFAAWTRGNSNFHFTTLAGRHVLLGFMPRDPARRAAAQARLDRVRQRFDGLNLACFLVATDAEAEATALDQLPGLRWFFDPRGEVSRLYGARDADDADQPYWLLLDPMLRVLNKAPLEAPEPLLAELATLPQIAQDPALSLDAPVLILPRVFDPEMCNRLIAYYDARGGARSGVMRDVGGKTIGVLDAFKSRRDVLVEEEPFRRELISRLERALIPMIARTYQFQATRLERYLVACYDAAEGGYFKPHRDDETFATAHRRFAVSINLNAEDFDGGDLRFPEFGQRTYRPPTGGAVVFCCSLQHEATRVTRGRRYAFLPFLYDEAGQRIREQNQALLDQSPAVSR